jgi:hypothetical protein
MMDFTNEKPGLCGAGFQTRHAEAGLETYST